MLLKITKSFKKGMMGGSTFELRPELVLNEDEVQLIDHYGLQDKPLASIIADSLGARNESDITVMKLASREIYRCKSLAEVMEYRERLIEACENLKALLIAAASFEGTEEIHIDALLVDVEEEVDPF